MGSTSATVPVPAPWLCPAPWAPPPLWTHHQLEPCLTGTKITMNAVAANLEGETAEWITSLHDEDTPELGNTDLFLELGLKMSPRLCKLK